LGAGLLESETHLARFPGFGFLDRFFGALPGILGWHHTGAWAGSNKWRQNALSSVGFGIAKSL